MLDDGLDVVVHLGDYLYEGASWADEVPRHEGPEPTTREEYRARHALYKLDPDLQRAHATYPWVVTGDDHEVDGDYAGAESQPGQVGQGFSAISPASVLLGRGEALSCWMAAR